MRTTRGKYIKFLLLLAVILPLPVMAEERKAISFEELYESALLKGELSVTAKARYLRARAQAQAPRSNPKLFVEVRPELHGTGGKEQELELGLEQDLKPGDFGQRGLVQDLGESAASLEEELALLELKLLLKQVYGRAWIIQERTQHLSDLLEQYKQLARAMNKSASQGLYTKSNLLLAQAGVSRVEQQLLGNQVNYLKVLQELNRLTFSSLKNEKLADLKLSAVPAGAADDFDLSALPAQKFTRLKARLARENARLTRMDAYPGLTPKVAYEKTDDGVERVNIGLSMELPIFDRNQSAISEARADALEAEYARRYRDQQLKTKDFDFLLEAGRLTEKQLQVYQTTIIPDLKSARQAVHQEFAAGQSDLQTVWSVLKEVREAEENYLELWESALATETDISTYLGKEY